MHRRKRKFLSNFQDALLRGENRETQSNNERRRIGQERGRTHSNTLKVPKKDSQWAEWSKYESEFEDIHCRISSRFPDVNRSYKVLSYVKSKPSSCRSGCVSQYASAINLTLGYIDLTSDIARFLHSDRKSIKRTQKYREELTHQQRRNIKKHQRKQPRISAEEKQTRTLDLDESIPNWQGCFPTFVQ